MVKDPFQALEDIIAIGGIQRILTSGCERSAYEGLDMLVQLVKRAQDRVIILPGAGTCNFYLQNILVQSRQDFSLHSPISFGLHNRNHRSER